MHRHPLEHAQRKCECIIQGIFRAHLFMLEFRAKVLVTRSVGDKLQRKNALIG